MAHHERHLRSSPPSTHDPSPDTSLSTSDRSLRSIHSAPSLTSSATLSNPSLNLNVHLIPLPNSHLHIHSESGDDSIDYSDGGSHHVKDSKPEHLEDSEADDTIQIVSPNIRITPSQERPQPDRTDSEQTVAVSPTRNASPDPETQRISVVSDAYTEDDTITEESTGVTEELRRTLFYRPSTDPIIVAQSRSRPEPEPDLELNAMLGAGATSSTNLLSIPSGVNFLSPASDANLLTSPETSPPTRPPRPPSLNLSDADEPKPKPKSVDLVRPGTGHSRMGSLGALFGKGNRSSFGGPRSSLGGGRPSLGGNHSHSGSAGTVQGGVPPLSIKGKTPEPFPVEGERVVQVHEVSAEGGVGLTRARTISEGSMAEMDRSVWEDDTEELGTAWGLVRKWLGDESKGEYLNLLHF
ncbi:hypothetical protein FRC08_014259 [Ceratobasidium sp. 394]|nr:hypothetical protein FRC08_014259 [Ceratobasidium sp. 394]